ncbi:tRNA uracil 4-sulfurtransferase ThiI [Intestinibaculum porci]|uniref:Probable tRNA sulfurtransferase n=1 Tax=Intestinibaculum porci TaxID=2487118 RepID=A0A3G9JJD7_9FIRM|nr:tRNA uracil 4-sulfurtransferase ThiI [Intestinibaculum porci]MDD6350302.1 tRNA 4-thiouridine(8) synthase ThiI [Intestinibaculum porci]MDD6423499.1 tRNA 4-thiouridine(8) synthase ThiI [Intestinibaculum porci]BBH26071.1 putative tRNA sulfurtransferase [Intestinibaculum porci]
MQANHIIVRFGELTTKGKNRKTFTRKLLKNTKEILKPFDKLTYELTYDHIFILLNGEDPQAVAEKLKTVFGIHSFSLCYKVEHDLEAVKEVAAQIINQDAGKTFKIETKRNDKSFPMTSIEMNKAIAGYVFHHTDKDLKVDVHHPEILVKVEFRKDYAYVMDNVVMGAGGYPVGIGGKALLMLSGGIDSPVAAYLTMKRGVDLEMIHYASPPYTNDLAREKVLDLVNVLRHYTHGKMTVHIIPFTKLQLSVYDHCDESYAMTVMRRMMYRIAEGLAQEIGAKAIVNGESIGQVASQTLDSMNTINAVITTPVIRPVACLDKLEIIKIAEKIGTYDISIRPFEDCCTIFTPHNPATKPKIYRCEEYEKNWDFASQVADCIKNRETIVIDENYKNDDELDLF